MPSSHPSMLRLQTRMQQIMAHCFLAVKSKLECKLGYFDLIGCDFLIDENFKVLLRCARAGGPGRQVQGGGDFCAHPDPAGVPLGWGGGSAARPCQALQVVSPKGFALLASLKGQTLRP